MEGKGKEGKKLFVLVSDGRGEGLGRGREVVSREGPVRGEGGRKYAMV